jgi:hypothetical protein
VLFGDECSASRSGHFDFGAATSVATGYETGWIQELVWRLILFSTVKGAAADVTDAP